ncbi:helix-turn-helix domain-containing protein [Paenibacillus sp. 1-18]|uniref:helix-turn-helix domain-containing protein n=1 Tax=Paenibacillus sp. 1-18 TaxID=1333846 RepID=UPI000471A782|nr:helix-turn-helix transcriptional regulator [Paenibacillus sp. 1-18]
MTNALLTREQYVAKKAGEWAEKGARFKERRETHRLTLTKVAEALGISPSTLRRFELGHPVQAANIIEKAYEMYFDLKIQNFVENEQKALLNAEYLIDQEIGGSGKVEIRRKQFIEVGVIERGIRNLTLTLRLSSANQREVTTFSRTNRGSIQQ